MAVADAGQHEDVPECKALVGAAVSEDRKALRANAATTDDITQRLAALAVQRYWKGEARRKHDCALVGCTAPDHPREVDELRTYLDAIGLTGPYDSVTDAERELWGGAPRKSDVSDVSDLAGEVPGE